MFSNAGLISHALTGSPHFPNSSSSHSPSLRPLVHPLVHSALPVLLLLLLPLLPVVAHRLKQAKEQVFITRAFLMERKSPIQTWPIPSGDTYVKGRSDIVLSCVGPVSVHLEN